MRRFVLAAALAAALVSPASAQQLQPDRGYTLTLTGAQIAYIGQALAKLPFGEVQPIMQTLQAQIAAQSQSQAQPPAPAAKPEPEPDPPK